MKIQIMYFAALREQTGLAEETYETNSQNPLQLYLELKEKYHFPLNENQLRVAINHQFERMDYELKDKDIVAFIPPVAGG